MRAEDAYLAAAFTDESLRRRAVTGAAATIVVQALRFALKFASVVVLGRLLVPADFGIVAMVAPIFAFVGTLNDLGFGQAIVQKNDITHRQVSALFWINLLVSIVLAAGLMAASPLVGWIYGEPKTIGVTIVLAALIVVGTLGLVPGALLSRRMRFVPQAVIEITGLAINIGTSVGAAFAGLGFWAIVLGQVANTIFGAVAGWMVVGWRPLPPRREENVRPLLSFGMNLTGVNLATYLSMTADNMIVGVFGGKVQLGLYDRSYNLVVQPLGQLMAPVARVAVPLLSRVSDEARYRATYLNMLRLTAVLTAPAMICCTLLPDPIIALLLGDRWHEAAPIFGWICLGGIFAPVFGTTGWLFTTQARTAEQMRLSIVTALISIASFAIGIAWGAVGVAAVSALSFTFIQTPLMLWRVTREGAVGLRDMIGVLIPLCIAGLGAVAAILGCERVIAGRPLLLVAMAVSYLVFCGLIFVYPGGRDFFRTLVNLRQLFRASPA